MPINGDLLDKIKSGKAVLFLGSGGLFGAKLQGNKDVPLGDDLKNILCDRFLEGEFKSESLAHVSAMAISISSLFDVQDYIKDYFSGVIPADFHKLITKFKWRAIFTTNYDTLIENCYSSDNNKVQQVLPILSNEDSLDITRKTEDLIPLLKLHGCISRTHDNNLPLILTVDQYNDSFSTRKRLFSHLYELAYENTIIFIGHSLQDHNVRHVLASLEKEAPNGMRHYLLKPNLKGIEKTYWESKRISALDLTFKNFLEEINHSITENERVLSFVKSSPSHPIKIKYSNNCDPSPSVIKNLKNNIEYIYSDTNYENGTPHDFFSGVDLGWYPVAKKIAIKRNIIDILITNIIERPDAERRFNGEIFCIKGEAGSGKTVLLRQLAWETRKSNIGVTLWVKDGAYVSYDVIEDIASNTNERLFLFWDNAAINVIEINRVLSLILRNKLKVTIITAERFNEWNIKCDILDILVSETFEMRYLSELEIKILVQALDIYNCLGPNLIDKSFEQRCSEFREIHGRQLLVALHEATMGEPFEDIVFDEYKNIFPEQAKSIYLTVCTLNRMKLPVRAGLISRIHGVSFEDFNEKLHRPLEKVVVVNKDDFNDIRYSARHSEIAEIVFHRALHKNDDRYQEYISIVRKLNTSYHTDRYLFRGLVKAKALHELFPIYEDVKSIYDHALSNLGEDPYLLQQMANYERIRSNGNLDLAIQLLSRAKELASYDQTIVHSLSIIWRDKSTFTDDIHEKRKCRAESRYYLDEILNKWGSSSHVAGTRLELLIDSMADIVQDDNVTEKIIMDSVRDVQSEISESKQKYPNDSHISTLEAKFSTIISDTPNVLRSLEKAFQDSDHEPFLAIRLSELYIKMDNFDKAINVIEQAIERRRNNHRLNFQYADMMRLCGDYEIEKLVYYYRRAFTPNDSNYLAQFWYARFSYGLQDPKEHDNALNLFRLLRNANIPNKLRHEVKDIDKDLVSNGLKQYQGMFIRKSQDIGFIKLDGTGDEIFIHVNDNSELLWEAVIIGDRISFNLGFSFNGPVAINSFAI